MEIKEPAYLDEETKFGIKDQPIFPIKLSKEYTDMFYGHRRTNYQCWISRNYNYSAKPVKFMGWYVRAMVDSIDDTYWFADFECETFEEAKEKFKIARRFLSVLPRKGVSLEYFKKYFIEDNGFTFDW